MQNEIVFLKLVKALLPVLRVPKSRQSQPTHSDSDKLLIGMHFLRYGVV